eukprot:SAG31_NODE_3378_length_4344_cov_7.620259_4_plen_207_part_00
MWVNLPMAAANVIAISFVASVASASEPCTAPVSAAADAVARSAVQVCGGASAEEALRSVGVPANEAAETARALAALGLHTALDMRLLGGGPEAEELLLELQKPQAGSAAEHLLSLGGRAKLRLLIGGAPQPTWFRDQLIYDTSASSEGALQSAADRSVLTLKGRHLQSDEGTEGMSLDTIVIVISVLVGAVGYGVQGGIFSSQCTS